MKGSGQKGGTDESSPRHTNPGGTDLGSGLSVKRYVVHGEFPKGTVASSHLLRGFTVDVREALSQRVPNRPSQGDPEAGAAVTAIAASRQEFMNFCLTSALASLPS
jgi:hypothetical protein